jgi:hypothetical protein
MFNFKFNFVVIGLSAVVTEVFNSATFSGVPRAAPTRVLEYVHSTLHIDPTYLLMSYSVFAEAISSAFGRGMV